MIIVAVIGVSVVLILAAVAYYSLEKFPSMRYHNW